MAYDIDDIPISEPQPANMRISWWFENTIVRAVKRILNATKDMLKQIFSFSITDFIERYENDLMPYVEPVMRKMLEVPNLPSFVRTPINKALEGKSQAGLAILAIFTAILAGGLYQGLSAPLGRAIEQFFDVILRSRLIDPGTLIVMYQRGIISESRLTELLALNGLNNEGQQALKQVAIPLEDDSLLTQALWRGKIGEEFVWNVLRKRGMDDISIQHWLESRKLIPSPGDLVTMATREAFDDSVAQRFGYDADYPTIAGEWAEKQGMDSQWFRRYWRAHWRLPGLVQIREMFHRGIISEEEVSLYMRASDIPVFWRDALIKWMQREVTRVDVRRMYSLGLINEQDVYDRYLRLGYNSEDSILMTQFTVATYMDKERELTKTDILNMYEDGILNEGEAYEYLTSMDYREGDISLLLAHRDLKRDEKWERQIISIVRKLYLAGIYERNDVFIQLGKIDTPGAFVEQTLQVWDLEKEQQVRIPSVTQLRDMAAAEVITVDTFRQEMENKGYNAKYIEWYVGLWLTGD